MSDAPAPPVAKLRRSWFGWMALLVVGVLLGAGVAVEITAWMATQRDDQAALTALTAQLAATEARLAAVAADLDLLKRLRGALDSRSDALDDRLGKIEALVQQGLKRADLDGLAARLDQLDERLRLQREAMPDAAALADGAWRLAALERRVADDQAANAQVAEHLQRLSQLEARLPAVERVEGALADLAARVRQLEAKSAQGAAAGALAVLVARLRESARLGAPFQSELNTFRALVAGNPTLTTALADLVPYAARGVPTVADLRERFAKLAPQALSSSTIEEGDGWWRRTWHRLQSLVVIRRVGVIPGPSIEAVVARAEFQLKDDNLQEAVDELGALQGVAAAVLAPWIEAAGGRLALDQALRELDQRLLAVFGGS
ncbi:MAG: hypothetical protein EXQ85_01725 [Alphaproteobacteria bacterium]|nr:hypothetical protein [Alphaproteobacteria bacterium]